MIRRVPILPRLFLLVLMLRAVDTRAGTVLDFWHSYTPPQTTQPHYSFHLANYKRGLFFGSCGFSTRSQQWAFDVDLSGDGPVYEMGNMKISDDSLVKLNVVSGAITIDEKRTVATITLQVEQGGVTNQFTGNGNYAIVKLK